VIVTLTSTIFDEKANVHEKEKKKEREEIKKIIFEKERVYIYILLIIFDEFI
jgi:hypothetical protein